MTKFTMNAKELKTMMDKGVAAIDKKSTLHSLRCLYFSVEENGTVKVLGTDMEHFAEIRSNSAWNREPGAFGIDIDDIKVLSKMSGDITLEDVSTEQENKLNVKCGNKTVSIPKYDTDSDIHMPDMSGSEELVLTVKENWLLETVVNLATFTSDNDNNKLMRMFNFNLIKKRVEALDGYRIGMRSLENQRVEKETQNPMDNLMLHNKCVPVFKKIMDKKSDADIRILYTDKFIKVEGKDFTYVVRRGEGEYFKIDQMLSDADDYKFTVDRENMLEVMQYNQDLRKNENDKPVVLHGENGKLFSYIRTAKYEAFDELVADDVIMSDDLYIGFNPQFFVDAFKIIDSDSPVCRGYNSKSPMFVTGEEYSFLILPVNISNSNAEENMSKHINKGKAA